MRIADVAPGSTISISFSGGRTSAYMTWWLLTTYRRFNWLVTFANTGREHPKTLDFVHNCDTQLGFGTVWLEAVAHLGERKSCTHKVVTYETAARAGEPFEAVIKKYGIPNQVFQPCTRELKANTMDSYRRECGFDPKTQPIAIGIREDEGRRVKDRANILYPLVYENPTDKAEVLDFWRQQPFDLNIEEFEGNCLGCFKKSEKKLFAQIEKDPSAFDWNREMEDKYRHIGPQEGDRVFRGHRDTRALFASYEAVGKGRQLRQAPADEDGGCSESCEPYETEPT